MALSIPFFISAFKVLARAQTAFHVRMSTSAIVSTGAFQYSRNPAYLSFTLLLVGLALALGSPWTNALGLGPTRGTCLESKFDEEYRR